MPGPGPYVTPFIPAPALYPDFNNPFIGNANPPAGASMLRYDSFNALLSESPGLGTRTAPAAGLLTITGPATSAGTFTVSIPNYGSAVAAVANTDTATQVATKVAAAINASAAFQGVLFATSAAGVVTMNVLNPTPMLNSVTVTASSTATGVGITPTAFGTGGTGPVIPQESFVVTAGGVTLYLRAGHPVLLSTGLLRAVQTSGRDVN
jgi:hypothetical protein